MKIVKTVADIPQKFEPIKLEITLETLEEATAFRCVFDYFEICEFLRQHCPVDVGATIRDLIGPTEYGRMFSEFVKTLKGENPTVPQEGVYASESYCRKQGI